MALFVLQPPSGGLFMMHFTPTRREKHFGAELCCDLCNKQPAGPVGSAGAFWWYVRYNIFDEHPSMWICDECKEEIE